MKFCGIEHLSLVDYDSKLTCTLFTNACNFQCRFCHNQNLVYSNNLQEIPFEDILDYLKTRKNYLEAVCISGGEPTLHSDLPNYIQKIKNLGYLIKLDTNGTNPKMLKHLIDNKLVDYIAMDIKTDLKNYPEITNVKHINLMNIQESINIIQNSNIDYEFRTTLVKEFHNVDTMINISNWIKNPQKYFLQKFKPSENCIENNLREVDVDTANEFKKILLTKFKNVELRGY